MKLAEEPELESNPCQTCFKGRENICDIERRLICKEVEASLTKRNGVKGSDNRRTVELMRRGVEESLRPHHAELLLQAFGQHCAGGDGVEVIPIETGKTICAFDLTGHGVPAAIERDIMTNWTHRVQNQVRTNGTRDIATLAEELNNEIAAMDDAPQVEGVLLHIDEEEKKLHGLSMGGMTTLLKNGNGVRKIMKRGTPAHVGWLGVDATLLKNMQPLEISFRGGDTLLICSDGIATPDGESQEELARAFGEQGMRGIRQIADRQEEDDVMALQITLAA